jgi:hypothetical protein
MNGGRLQAAGMWIGLGRKKSLEIFSTYDGALRRGGQSAAFGWILSFPLVLA